MSSFTGKSPAQTYGFILQCPTGLSGTLRTIEDGFGVSGPYKISTTTVSFPIGKSWVMEAGSTADFTAMTPSFTDLTFTSDNFSLSDDVAVNRMSLGFIVIDVDTVVDDEGITFIDSRTAGSTNTPPQLTNSESGYLRVIKGINDNNLTQVWYNRINERIFNRTRTSGVYTDWFQYVQANEDGDVDLSGVVSINKGTAVTTAAETLASLSQIGEAVDGEVQVGVDSGNIFNLKLVDASATLLGSFQHNQTGGPSGDGAFFWDPNGDGEGLLLNDTRLATTGDEQIDLGGQFTRYNNLFCNGYLQFGKGATGARPSPSSSSAAMWFDTTLGIPIFTDDGGTTWYDAAGNDVT